MLERLIEDTRVGDFVLDFNSSSNSIFAKNGAVELSLSRAVELAYDGLYGNKDTSLMSNKEKIARLTTANALIGAMGTAYVAAESVCRASELVTRGTGELLKRAGNLAHDKLEFVENLTEKVKETYQNILQKISRPTKKRIRRLYERIKNPLVVGLSVAALALGYGGVKSCSEDEPPAIVEPVQTSASELEQEEERTIPRRNISPEEAANQYFRNREERTPRREQRPIINQQRQVRETRQGDLLLQCRDNNQRSEYQLVADAAKERAVAQRSNYAFRNTPTSPLEGLTSNTNPGRTKISWLRNRNKCNQFVGDALVQAGYQVPTHEMRDGSLHYKEIEQFPHEGDFFDKVTNFCDIKPGQVMVIDYPGRGESTAHGEIIHSVDHQNGIVWSYGAHEDGAYKMRYDLFQRARFSPSNNCWKRGGDSVCVLKPINRR